MEELKKYVALQTEFVQDWLITYDYSQARLFNAKKNKLVQDPTCIFRRGNDWLAAAYMHAVALDQGSGDDCIDAMGNSYELKLAVVDASQFHIGSNGSALLYGSSGTSLNQAINAKFKVHPGTSSTHHTKETAHILMSKQHNCYITGFIMAGGDVQKLLMNGSKTTINRSISLGNFISHGYEFQSGVPHIGWDRYTSALANYVKAKEKRITGKEAVAAVRDWVELANPNNLSKLKKS